MRVLSASIRCEKGDVDGNLDAHVEVLEEARQVDCDLVVFPEFSLTGSVDPAHHPERAIALDHRAVVRLVAEADRRRLGTVFGIGERLGDSFAITQAYALEGRISAVQRKRHLGDGEEPFTAAVDTTVFDYGALRFGSIICAESSVDQTWDAVAAAGAELVCLSSAPGLHGRRLDEESWRDGYDWWRGRGLADARRHAERLGVWVVMATQAGSTVDEDFPGVAALVAPTGEVVEQLPDWRPGTLVVDVPLPIDAEQAVRNAHDWFADNSGWAPPDDETLAEWLADGVCRCPDECLVAPRAWCRHGLASWWLILHAEERDDRHGRRS